MYARIEVRVFFALSQVSEISRVLEIRGSEYRVRTRVSWRRGLRQETEARGEGWFVTAEVVEGGSRVRITFRRDDGSDILSVSVPAGLILSVFRKRRGKIEIGSEKGRPRWAYVHMRGFLEYDEEFSDILLSACALT